MYIQDLFLMPQFTEFDIDAKMEIGQKNIKVSAEKKKKSECRSRLSHMCTNNFLFMYKHINVNNI